MTKEVQEQLISDHFLFKEGDRFLQAANASRFWPTGRGIFHNTEKTFLVWVGEEDHLRIISMQQGGDVGQVSCDWWRAGHMIIIRGGDTSMAGMAIAIPGVLNISKTGDTMGKIR